MEAFAGARNENRWYSSAEQLCVSFYQNRCVPILAGMVRFLDGLTFNGYDAGLKML
jgi:hypothetical protein